jgi:hypothetical protein
MTGPLRLPPGIHTNVRAADYHADPCEEPSLSSSIAKIILRDTPRHAWHAHPRLNPGFEPKDDSKFNVGSVAHELILGRGGGFDVLDYDDWRKKEAQEKRDASWSAGRTPILAHQYADAEAIYSRIWSDLPRNHDVFMDWTSGDSEVVLIWHDIGGALCRAMLDRVTPAGVIYDVKCTDAGLSDAQIARQIVNMGYDLSAGMYVRGLSQLRPELAGRIRYVWLMVETSEPYEFRLIEADGATLAMGDRKTALAIEKWRRCIEAASWPGYPPEISRLPYPGWAESSWLERELTDDAANAMHVIDRAPPRAPQQLMEPV